MTFSNKNTRQKWKKKEKKPAFHDVCAVKLAYSDKLFSLEI